MLLVVISKLVEAYSLLILIYVLLSWVPTQSGVVRDINNALAKICDPYLDIFRKHIPPIGGMVDISPIIALIALQLAERLLYFIL